MLSENTTILMASGEIKDIANVTANSYVMCADGSAARVVNVTQGYQKIYNIQQKTKHRAFEGEPGRLDPRRRTVYQRLALQCTAGHKLSVRVPTKPLLEKSGRNATKYKVRWRNLQQCQTLDGRIITIPKNHHKTFPMTVEGEYAAKRFIEEMERSKGEYFNFDIEVRDLDYLDAQLRISSCIRFGPVLTGNGVLSKFLTGRSDLVTPAVKSMAWMLGLWLGDGTTKEPEISVDSLDPKLMESLRDHAKIWGLYLTVCDDHAPLRAKHVRLHYGDGPGENRKTRNLRKNNPFWKAVTILKFKRDLDGEKQIPEFMYGEHIEVREAFLAGLIDSDGYVVKKGEGPESYKIAIQTVYSSIMDGIVHISRSLGMSATVTTRSAREEIIEGRKVQCQFTYDCNVAGGTTLQNVLSYCRSGHKTRDVPLIVKREPVYFGFTDDFQGESTVYGLTIEGHKNFLLGNKIEVKSCRGCCVGEQLKISQRKNLKHCVACPRKGIKYFYKDWSGKNRVCARCYGRYKFSGHHCINCKYVPEAREVKKAKEKGEKLGITPEGLPIKGPECLKCGGILQFDAVRGPHKSCGTNVGARIC